MSEAPVIQRKLTTILAADAANYSGRMAQDEVGTVQALRAARRLIDAAIAQRGGRIANTSGDGLIAEFPSVVEAVAAAVVIQRGLNEDAQGLPFRIGLHLGDVIVEGDDLLGDGVNLAARLQEMAPQGGIFASQQVVDHARGRLAAKFRPLGPHAAKHLPDDIAVFAVLAEGVTEAGDLEPLLPRAARDVKPSRRKTAAPPSPTRARYERFRNRAGIVGGVLVLIDIVSAPGQFWSVWPVGIIALIVWLKWRRLPDAERKS